MADKVDKPKKKTKQKKDEKGVLAALPSTRPERIGGRRAAAASSPGPKTTAPTAASKAASKPAAKRSAAAKTSAAATRPSTAKRANAAAKKTSKPRATAARRKAAAPRTFEPTQAAESAAGAADERAAGAIPLGETPRRPEERSYPRPRPVSEGARGIGTGGYRDQPSQDSGRPSGVELATTAVKAAGEVAQLGLTIGGHVLKRVVDRLPKP
jgi:hypothetical protein